MPPPRHVCLASEPGEPGDPSTTGPEREEADAALRRLVRDWLVEGRDALTDDAIDEALRTGRAVLLTDDPAWAEAWAEAEGDWVERLIRLEQRTGAAQFEALEFALQFELDNPHAARFAAEQTARMVTRVGDETKRAIRAIVGSGYVEGVPPRDQAMAIRPLIGLTERDATAARRRLDAALTDGVAPEKAAKQAERYEKKLLARRAENIARTETLSAENAGQDAAWQTAVDAGLLDAGRQREWIATPGSERTCEMCLPMHGQRVALGVPFTDDEGGEIDRPPLHPSCFVAGTEVCGPRVVGSTDRWYRGAVVEIEAGGHGVSVTPNHPLLTRSGWIAAGELHEGDDLVCCGDRERMLAAIDPDHHQVPARIEEVAKALGGAGGMSAAKMPVAAEDFHGDGKGSEVYVVRADRLLRDRVDAALAQPDGEQFFVGADPAASRLPCQGPGDPLGFRGFSAAAGEMGGFGQRLVLFGRPPCGHEAVGAQWVADLDFGLDEPSSDGRARDPEQHREGVLGFAGEIAPSDFVVGQVVPPATVSDAGLVDPVLDDDPRNAKAGCDRGLALAGEVARHHLGVVEGVAVALFFGKIGRISRREFAGHVFNLETAGGWYSANGIIAHNCRCTTGLVVEG